jgi:drug/metabolite transporter (DMT)-like permease
MPAILAVGFVWTWSSGFIGAKWGVGVAPVSTLLTWRFVPLAGLLAVVCAVRYRGRCNQLDPRALAGQIGVGMLSQSGYLITVYAAIALGVSSGTTALIDGIQPLVVGVLAGPLLGQHTSIRQWVGLLLGLAGAVTVTLADAGANPAVAPWAYGVPVLGMLCLVAATFLDRRRGCTEVGTLPMLTVHCLTSAVVFTGLAVGTGTIIPPADLRFWASVGWLVLFSTLGGYGLYWLLLRRSGVTVVNALMFLMAPVTAVWGAAMFGEPLGWRTGLGLVLGVLAVALVTPSGWAAGATACCRSRARGRWIRPRRRSSSTPRPGSAGPAAGRRGSPRSERRTACR